MGAWSSRGRSDVGLIAESVERPERFAAIFDRHYDAIHGYLARRVGVHLADDLAAQTFVVAFEKRGSFSAAAVSARPWLFGIATNLLRNQWRAEQRALAALARLVPPPAVQPADEHVGGDVLALALQQLDQGQRDVLLLYAWEGLSYEEISAALGIAVGTVRSRMARGRARLSAALSDAEPPRSPRVKREMVE